MCLHKYRSIWVILTAKEKANSFLILCLFLYDMLELDTTPLDKHFCNHIVVHTRTCLTYYILCSFPFDIDTWGNWSLGSKAVLQAHTIIWWKRQSRNDALFTIPPDVSRCISQFFTSQVEEVIKSWNMCLNISKGKNSSYNKNGRNPESVHRRGDGVLREWNKEISLMRNEQITMGVRSNKVVFEYSWVHRIWGGG